MSDKPKLRAFILARKEFFQYLYAPAFYGAAVFFLVFCSAWLFYFQQFFAMDSSSLRPFFSAFPIAYIFVIPCLTMKSWAEERKTGTIELLLTMPFTEWDLVLGKFFSVMGVLSLILLCTLPLPLSLLLLGNFEIGVLLSEYAGSLLLAASAVSLGLLMSSLSKNQAGSFLSAAAVLMAVMLVNQLVFSFNLPGPLASLLNYLSLSYHFEGFTKGIIDTRDALFFILCAALFLFLNTRVILFRKWR